MLRLSHSSLTTYNECPLKYRFQYIDKVPRRPKHFFSFGQSVHKALEYFHGDQAMPALRTLLEYFDEHFIHAGYKSEKDEEAAQKLGRKMLTAYWEKHSKGWRPALYTELHFDFTLDWLRITGSIDRMDLHAEGIEIIDYKTGKEFDKARVERDAQLSLYQLACEVMGHLPIVKLTLYHVPSVTAYSVTPRHPKEQLKLRAEIFNTAEKIMNGEFEAKPSEPACQWCDYKNICPVWREK